MNKMAGVCIHDMSAAFDTIDHELLIRKFSLMNILLCGYKASCQEEASVPILMLYFPCAVSSVFKLGFLKDPSWDLFSMSVLQMMLKKQLMNMVQTLL